MSPCVSPHSMERKIIRVLGFNLSAVTAEAFAGYFTQKLHLDSTASMLAAFFTQSMLLHLPLLVCYPPADRAAAAVFLAQCATADERPSDEWVCHFSYSSLSPTIDTHSFSSRPYRPASGRRSRRPAWRIYSRAYTISAPFWRIPPRDLRRCAPSLARNALAASRPTPWTT
jgi:hypothetical protein